MKRFLSKFNIYYFEIIFLLVIGLTPLLWYKDGYIALGHDMGFPLAPIDNFLDRLYTWSDRLGPFGSNTVQVLPGVFIHGLEALLFSFGFSLLVVQKITYIFWFVLPGITMYILLRYLHPAKEDFPIRISGSLFYMMNHYLLQAWTIAERTKFSIVAALPLVVLLIAEVLHKKKSPVKNSILLALILFFLNGGEGIPLLISLFIVLIVTTKIFFFLSNESFWPKTKRLLLFSLLSAFFWILLSSYWLYPYFTSYNQTFGQRFDEAWGTAGALSWSQGISANTSWLNLFKLTGIPDWYNPDHPFANEFFKNPLLIFLNFLILALALVGLLFFKNLKGLLFKVRVGFLGLLLVAIPLSAGSHSPLGLFYDYLLANVPGFVLFRSSFFKFGMIIWLAYAYLVAVGLKDVIDWLKTKVAVRYKARISLVLLGVYVASLLVYNYPFMTGSFFNYSKDKSTMIKVPDYILQSKKDIDNSKFSTKTLLLPNSDLRTEYIEYNWGYFSLVVLQNSFSRKTYVINSVLARSNERDLVEGILSEYIQFGNSNLIRFTGIDKAIVQNDFVSPDYEDNPLSGATKSFEKSQDFTFMNSFGEWDFYNYSKNSLPQIYSPSKVTFVSSLGDDLDLVANLPGALDGDAYLWSEFSDNSEKDIFDKFVIQARCTDCPPAESYQIYFSTSKVLVPGTVFYELGKFMTDARKHLTGSPNSRLDINLATSTTLISDLGSLQATRDEKGVSVIVRDLVKNLGEIRFNLQEIPDPKDKKEALKKVHFFQSFFVSYESQWAASAQPGLIKSDLITLETELKKSLNEIEGDIGRVKIEIDDKLYKYSLDIPKTGDYDLYLYTPSPLINGMTLSANNRTYRAQKFNSNWHKVTKVSLEKNTALIEIEKPQTPVARPAIFAVLIKNALEFTSPNIEFVALNQTKYLVRTKGSENFLIGFNSRFDPNWNLTEIDTKLADKYFVGDKRSFLNGKVIEYEREDKHIITDVVFPNNKTKLPPSFQLNGFSNGWILDLSNLNSEKTFLLEYNNQNDFYKAAAVSVATLLIMLFFYLFRYAKNKD